MRRIGGFAGRIADRFSPLKIILFGSHARGQGGPESDVDLLVITDTPPGPDASLNIRRNIACDFPVDILVYDVHRLAQRIAEGDFFLQDALQEGKVLYERSGR